MKPLPSHGGCFAGSNHDIIILHAEGGQAYKEFTLKPEPKTTRVTKSPERHSRKSIILNIKAKYATGNKI